MALTDSSRIFTTDVEDIRSILDYCETYFTAKNYSVKTEEMANGGFISITNGGWFKSISGMQTGLNITITKMPNALSVSMKVGLFGKQLVPTAISMLVFWPMLIPQIYGLVQQNKLDTEAYDVISTAIQNCEMNNADPDSDEVFCVYCGATVPGSAEFCTSCGKKLVEDPSVCTACGAELSEAFAFCPKCGEKIESNN